MAKNYLPFARRVYLDIGLGDDLTVPREAFSSGFGKKAFLSDVAIDFCNYGRDNVSYQYEWHTARVDTQHCLMRMGIFGRPYLTKEFYPIALYANRTADESGVWRFPKPYTIFPGERLKARVLYAQNNAVNPLPASGFNAHWNTWPSISFFGIKRNTNNPIILHDSFPSTFDPESGNFANPPLGQPTILQGERLQCPKDSPVDIYAVKDSMGDAGIFSRIIGNSPHATQIYSPDGRKWWENDNWPMILRPTFIIKDLNSPEWVLNPDETIQIQILNPAWHRYYNIVILTLRGQLEVEV